MVGDNHFPLQALKTRAEHLQKYIFTVFCRDYVSYVKSGRRNEHSKFEELVNKSINDKKIQQARNQAKEESRVEAEQNRGFFNIFG